MGRYANAGRGGAVRPAEHWSDRLQSGSPWAEVTLQVSASRQMWAEMGIAPEEQQARLNQLVEKIMEAAADLGIDAWAAVLAEVRSPNV